MIHTIDTDTLQEQLTKLWAAKRSNAVQPLRYGLCTTCDVMFTGCEFLMTDWPESTGTTQYPVPAPAGFQRPRVGADAAYWSLPRWTGEYGSSRIRLMNYMIRRIERELAKRAA